MIYRFLAILLTVFGVCACTSDEPKSIDKPEQPTPEQPAPDDPEPVVPDDPEPPVVVKDRQYKVAQLSIDTEGGAEIESKETYVKCRVTIDADGDDWDMSVSAGVRGRGNSTWFWYDKKPYRIKLDKKSSVLGLPEGKSWVLLANYRDPADLMNTFVFELGQMAGLPFTNHNRYVELTLNGAYKGLYQLTEQVQQGKGRVNVDEKTGYLLSLDVDDGPAEAPNAGDNFWSQVYGMPVCVKNPEKLTPQQISDIRDEFAVLEAVIRSGDYEKVKSLMDIKSYIDFVMIQEFVYNVELDAPRSMYIHRDNGGLWTMGPLWDFDGGYDFDWGNMYTGHTYFNDYKESVLGTDPAAHKGTVYRVPGFFSDLFKVREFVSDYKTRWRQMSMFIPQAWENTLNYVDEDVWAKEEKLWPIGKSYTKEIQRMGSWISNRTVYMSNIINAYPNP